MLTQIKINECANRLPQQALVLDYVRSGIARGRWEPGQRLPSIKTMAGEFGISSATAQSAVHQLARDGFVDAQDRRGLFVANRPPNRNRFALVFPNRESESKPWSLYWKALAKAAQEIEKSVGLQFPIFYDEEFGPSSRDYDELVGAVTNDCVAGIIFAHSPHMMRGTPVLDHPGIPRVAFMSGSGIPGVTSVSSAPAKWLDTALQHLASRGKRRVAILLHSAGESGHTTEPKVIVEMREGLRRRGMETRNIWIQSVAPFYSDWGSHIMELMFTAHREHRPDALIIHDDNLAESAQRGLAAAHVRVPSDLEIVVNCNYPCPPPAVFPMHRLGIDAREILTQCVLMMLNQRLEKPLPALTHVPIRTDASTADLSALLGRIRTAIGSTALA